MLRTKQKLGKYRIEKRLADGDFANVYQALDTIEGIRVALKVPHVHLMSKEVLADFRKEVRLTASLDHPNILSLKNASFINAHFVIAFPLGKCTLADRLQHRMSLPTLLGFADQMLRAVAYAHQHRIIHCDIKPENLILFDDDRLRLTDFGIAKLAWRTIHADGSGTVGYIAPEQAMGRPSLRSDVFSLGLVLYRMLSGRLPEWPYEWPPPGFDRLRGRVHPDLIDLVRRAMEVNPRKRFRDAEQLYQAFLRVRPRALKHPTKRREKREKPSTSGRDWQQVRRQQFQRQFGRLLATRYTCERCNGPVSGPMRFCPWCKKHRRVGRETTSFPIQCPRCRRGMKLDWVYCPWCYGAAFEPSSNREYSDRRYQGRCTNPGCSRKVLMPFMRYCPWCRRKVRRYWKIPGSNKKCDSCGWGVLKAFWDYCPWCSKSLR